MATPGFFAAELPSSHGSKNWGLEQMSGRLVEISGHHAAANLTVAFGLVLEAQKTGEPVAWVTLKQSTFFPPDVADTGVDLAHLAVVRVEDPSTASRAVVELTRSGGFGLVVLDLGPEAIREKAQRARKGRGRAKKLATPFITKLVGLAQRNATAVVVLTERPPQSSSLSSLISLRAETRRDKDILDDGCEVEVAVVKDKRRGPGRCHREVCRVPAGLR
jgi:recombination protein RecA